MNTPPLLTSNRLWPRATTTFLLLVGFAMAAIGFATVMSMPDMGWHSARDAELRATYDAYRETGTLLIKESGSGSYGVQAPADGPLTFATWDDDPGSYIIASLMSHVTGSDSPYLGLKLAQALLVAIPLLWLPLAVARVVGRARAGFAMLLLPVVILLFNHGATLVGTEYGLSDRISTLPVYSLYGTAASLAFLSLSLVVLLSTYRLRTVALVGATVGIAVLAATGNMSRSLSGMGVAAAVGVLWWMHARGPWKWPAALGGALAAIVLAAMLQTGVMTAINVQRAETTGQAMSEVPDAHTAWHSLYLGLSYPQPLNGEPSRFDVTWSDEFGWAKAKEVDPDVLVASEEYDEILRDLYMDEVLADPVGALKLYVQKSLYLAKHFGGLLLFILTGFVVGMSVRSGLRARLGRVLAIALPLLVLGLVPAIMVMPMLYYYSELAAALGLFAAVSLGVIVWALTSWPARVRARERIRVARDVTPDLVRPGSDATVSVVVDEAILRPGDLDRLAGVLTDGDELVLTASADTVDTNVSPLSAGSSVSVQRVTTDEDAGVGTRLRAGVLRTSGNRVIIVGSSVPSELDGFTGAIHRTGNVVVFGVSGPGERTWRQRVIAWWRRLLLGSKGFDGGRILVLDGRQARALSNVSRQDDDLWFDELAFALETSGLRPQIVPTENENGSGRTHTVRSRTVAGVLAGISAIALRREEYDAAVVRDVPSASIGATSSTKAS
jgi:hypothetical protein